MGNRGVKGGVGSRLGGGGGWPWARWWGFAGGWVFEPRPASTELSSRGPVGGEGAVIWGFGGFVFRVELASWWSAGDWLSSLALCLPRSVG